MLSAPVVSQREAARLGRELRQASALFESEGWLDDPARYHETPPPLEVPRLRAARALHARFVALRFESGYAPHAGEPGRARWLGYRANRTAHAWLLEHAGAPRPWLVCVPGYRMGSPVVDFTGFRAPWLHRALGINVAVPVLPLHGPRSAFARGGDGFLRGDFVDTLHAQAQAVWDVRRLVGWLRSARGAPAVGVHGVSLGAYTASLAAGLEPFDCLIAGIPTADFVGLLRAHMPALAYRLLERLGVDFSGVTRLLRVVSPLAFAPRVAHERRFLYAGTADRLAPQDQALALWRHWDEPRIAWFHGSHVSFAFEPEVKRVVASALEASGFSAS